MAAKLTSERAVREAIEQRFKSPEYAVLPGVSNGTGAHHRRTIDAVIMSLWPSRGLTLAGVEIKVSRADLVRELANPAKQEAHFKFFDYFYLAVGDASIVRDGEVPATWGLLVPGRGGTSMKVAKEAPKLSPEPISRAFLAAILRRADEHATSITTALRAELRKEIEVELGAELERLRKEAEQHADLEWVMKRAELVDRFFRRANVRFTDWNLDAIDRAADIVRAMTKGGREGFLATARREADGSKRVAERMIREADDLLAELDKLEAEDPAVTETEATVVSEPG